MDAVTLDGMLGELRPRLVGRHLSRVRIVGPHAVAFAVTGDHRWLWLEAGRGIAGLYLVDKDALRGLSELAGGEAKAAGRTRQALLLLRKHVSGARITGLSRLPGERLVVLEAGEARLALRLSGSAPALTVVVGESPLATLGEGPPAWPLPKPAPDRDWDRIEAALITRACEGASGGSLVRSILGVAPALGPDLARELGGTDEALETLRARLRGARPTLIAPGPVAEWTDAALSPARAVLLLPLTPAAPTGAVLHSPSWTAAAATFLTGRLRGGRFEEARGRILDDARRRSRRLAQLKSHLEDDQRGMPEPASLRRQAEALLAAPPQPTAPETVEVDDPYAPGTALKVRVDPRLSWARNADQLFERARRIERAREKVRRRLEETRTELENAREREDAVLRASNFSELPGGRPPGPVAKGGRSSSGPRRYLTSTGLTLLVGRGAKENQEVTFGQARPEDFWLHARGVPGAHVVLRDDEGRAKADDVREAAEVAAFFSEGKAEGQVDVHVARRKHVRAGRGRPGRVTLGHSETLRVTPRDPEGRLRRR